MTERRSPTAAVPAVLFALLHAVNDQYTSYLSAAMPLLMDRFGFGLGVAGLLSSVQSTSTSFAQPIFGFVLDRARRQPSILLWPVVTAISLSVFGLVPSVAWLFPLLVIGGLSTAAFHPHASSAVPARVKGNVALGMSIFVSGGTLGYAVGPVFILAIVNGLGLRFSWLAALPCLALCLLLARRGLARAGEQPQAPRKLPKLSADRLKPLLAVWLVVVFRSIVGSAYTSFMGVHLRSSGFPIMQVGMALSTFTLTGVLGTMAGGALADRVGRKKVILGGLALVAPVFWLLLRARGWAVWPMMAAAGFAISTFNPLTVLMAQELLPESRGVASGLIMGLGWSIGGLLVSAVGRLAESFGLVTVLSWMLLLLAPALLFAWRIPEQLDRPAPTA